MDIGEEVRVIEVEEVEPVRPVPIEVDEDQFEAPASTD
jgi:hypothetical protein